MKQQTVNEFKDGLNLDLHPLVTPKTVLTDNINGTFITYNGNEFCLQNDRGNKEVAELTSGYIPIGIKEHNGVLYIISVKNEGTEENPDWYTEIGTYPGVNWNVPKEEEHLLDKNVYTPLKHLYVLKKVYNKGLRIQNWNGERYNEVYSCLIEHGVNETLIQTALNSEGHTFLNVVNVDECAEQLRALNVFRYVFVINNIPGSGGAAPMLSEFRTSVFGFTDATPVTIEVQDSYDGSVNLIFVDGKNKNRLINTGFSVLPNNKYKLIQRNQNQYTNSYSLENIDQETLLIRTSNVISNIDLKSVQPGGQLKGGNYTFYIKFGDADFNQTDVVAESGIVSIFNGTDGVPSTISGTLLNERTDKMVQLEISGLNRAYSKIYIYYSREYSDAQGYRMTEYGMFSDPIDMTPGASTQEIWLTGFEQTVPINSESLNVDYHTVDWSRAEAQHSNMLFLGNIGSEETFQLYRNLQEYTKNNVETYLRRTNLSVQEGDDFSNANYYSTKNIYNSLGYWPDEWYRFGIVYILDDGSTTPVFNMTGGFFKKEGYPYSLIKDDYTNYPTNEKGIFKTLSLNVLSSNGPIAPIYFNFELTNIDKLNPKVKGWFVVRQKRIPVTICQGISIATDKRSYIPMLWSGKDEEGKWMVESFLSLDRTKEKGEHWKWDKDCINGIKQVSKEPHILRPFLEIISENKYNYHINGSVNYITSLPTIIYNNAAASDYKTLSHWTLSTNDFEVVKNSVETSEWGLSATKCVYENGIEQYFSEHLQDWSIYIVKIPIKYKFEDNELVETSNEYLLYIMYNSVFIWYNNLLIGEKTDFTGTDETSFIVDYNKQYNKDTLSKVTKEKYRYIFETDNDVNKNAILSLDPCVNNSIGSIFDGTEFTLQKEYNLTLEKQDNELIFNYNIQNIQNKKCLESVKTVFVNNSKYKVLDNVNIFSNIAGSGNNAMDFAYSKKPFGVKTYSIDDSNSDENRYYWRDDRITDVFGTSDYYGYNSTHNVNLIRGVFTPYLGINKEINLGLYSIRQKLLTNLDNVKIREQDNSEFYSVSTRNQIERSPSKSNILNVYRGDCYICKVGMRILNNFVDSTAPVNSTIVDPLSWERWVRQRSLYGGDSKLKEDGYKDIDSYAQMVDYSEVNLSDLNAVDLGYWVTFPCLSSYNLGLRSEDRFHTDEMALFGTSRSFYPLSGASSISRVPDSYLLNDGLSATVGKKRYNLMPDVPYSKSEFSNRIMFSNVNITDAFTNGYRTFQGLAYKDYDKQYGAITKLIPLGQNIFIVMEHGLGLVSVNPKALIQTTTGEAIHIYGHGVLPDEMIIISQDYGSKYEHSVIRTPIGIYGVDVDTKKIWRFSDKQGFETISDMKIETYLKDFLSQREIKMNVSDIRTHYNAKKGDLMFAWYPKADENSAYMICYNERQNLWTTKYDWYPIVSENINDEFYSLKDETIWEHSNDVGYNGTHVSSWYSEPHGFEFEFVVSDPIGVNKIYDNLQIISNNVQPDEMEITIIGDDYEFKRDLVDLTDKHKELAEYENTTKIRTTSNIHGNNTYNSDVWDYKYDNRLNQKAIKAYQKFKDIYKYGRRSGNIQYKDGSWYTQIAPLQFNINGLQLKKEVRIRDKWAKIRIRYTGKDLAVITAIKTLINI